MREAERLARGAVHLGDTAETERVLEAARRSFAPEVAACEKLAEARRRLQGAEIARERLEIERCGDVERVEEPRRVRERKSRECCREGVVAEEREAFLRCELEAVEHAMGEVGVRREIRHPDRAECSHGRRRAVVQPRDEMLEQLEPDARRAAGEAVRDQQELRAHDVGRRSRALADAVLEDQAPVELREVARLDGRSLAHADTRRQAVDGRVTCEGALDDRPAGLYALGDICGKRHTLAASCDRQQVVEREHVAGERDRHRG